MKRFYGGVAAALVTLGIAACRSQQLPLTPDYRSTATVREIMESIIDPSADVLWESVSSTLDASGVTERRPQTNEDWLAVRGRAVTILEATNLLLMPGRQIARSGEKSDAPGIELEPAEIEARIRQDPASWTRFAHGLHDAMMPVLKAIDARDATGLMDAGEAIDQACEQCHLTYWYPPKK